MKRNKKLEASICRASARLGKLVAQYQAELGFRITIFNESGGPNLINEDLDSEEACKLNGFPGSSRASSVEDGGVLLLSMPTGGAQWDGGGW